MFCYVPRAENRAHVEEEGRGASVTLHIRLIYETIFPERIFSGIGRTTASGGDRAIARTRK